MPKKVKRSKRGKRAKISRRSVRKVAKRKRKPIRKSKSTATARLRRRGIKTGRIYHTPKRKRPKRDYVIPDANAETIQEILKKEREETRGEEFLIHGTLVGDDEDDEEIERELEFHDGMSDDTAPEMEDLFRRIYGQYGFKNVSQLILHIGYDPQGRFKYGKEKPKTRKKAKRKTKRKAKRTGKRKSIRRIGHRKSTGRKRISTRSMPAKSRKRKN